MGTMIEACTSTEAFYSACADRVTEEETEKGHPGERKKEDPDTAVGMLREIGLPAQQLGDLGTVGWSVLFTESPRDRPQTTKSSCYKVESVLKENGQERIVLMMDRRQQSGML